MVYMIYANIGDILMGSMLPYIPYMDPMGIRVCLKIGYPPNSQCITTVQWPFFCHPRHPKLQDLFDIANLAVSLAKFDPPEPGWSHDFYDGKPQKKWSGWIKQNDGWINHGWVNVGDVYGPIWDVRILQKPGFSATRKSKTVSCFVKIPHVVPLKHPQSSISESQVTLW